MRAQYQEVREYAERDIASVDLTAAAAACRLRVAEAGPQFASLRAGTSWRSWGETLTVHTSELDGRLLIEVASSSVVPMAIEDFGKNRKNVRRLFDALEQQVGQCDSRVVPICAECGYRLIGVDAGVCPECGARIGETPKKSLFRRKLRSASIWFVEATGAELLIVFGLKAVGLLPADLAEFATLAGMLKLAAFNAAVLFGTLFWARLRTRDERTGP